MKKSLRAEMKMTVTAPKEKDFNNTAQIEKDITKILRAHGYKVGATSSIFCYKNNRDQGESDGKGRHGFIRR